MINYYIVRVSEKYNERTNGVDKLETCLSVMEASQTGIIKWRKEKRHQGRMG